MTVVAANELSSGIMISKKKTTETENQSEKDYAPLINYNLL